MANPKLTMTKSELLECFPEPVAETAAQLIACVARLLPTAEKRVHAGWGGIGFRHPDEGHVCGVYMTQTLAKLYFEHGIFLEDPHNLLRGCGKQARYIELEPGDVIPEEAIKAFLEQLVDLG